VSLGDNEVIEADSYEEANKLLVAKLSEARGGRREAPVEEPKPAVSAEKPSWDFDKFAKQFVQDPDGALDYMDTVKVGAPVRKLIPPLMMLVQQMAKKVQELEVQNFVRNSDYEPSPENRKAVQAIIEERGWEPNARSLQDAYDIAKGRGLIKSKEKEEPVRQQAREEFVPPRVRGNATPVPDQIDAIAQDLPIEKLEELLLRGGIISHRRFS
jgi:hypothetical protein